MSVDPLASGTVDADVVDGEESLGRKIVGLVLDGFYDADIRRPIIAGQIIAVGTNQGIVEQLDTEDELSDSVKDVLLSIK